MQTITTPSGKHLRCQQQYKRLGCVCSFQQKILSYSSHRKYNMIIYTGYTYLHLFTSRIGPISTRIQKDNKGAKTRYLATESPARPLVFNRFLPV